MSITQILGEKAIFQGSLMLSTDVRNDNINVAGLGAGMGGSLMIGEV